MNSSASGAPPNERDDSAVDQAETIGPESQRAPAGNGPDLSNRCIGDFHLLRRIGRGGMAEVYLAEQKSLKRRVAFKVLREDLIADESYRKRFQHEATAAAALSHPNIVQVFVIGEADGVHFIAQEYVQGHNLREYIQRNGPPELATALSIMKQVASALQLSGEAGIVHRDVKPENILLTKRGEVKVTDFGLAQLSQRAEGVQLTQVGITMGTPLYMSPEQVHARKLDPRSDIYSFGVTCYHMLAGRPPFQGETALAVAVQHLNKKPQPLRQRRPDLPPALCELVHRMMAKNRDDRPATAAVVLNELEELSRKLQATGALKASGAHLAHGDSRLGRWFDKMWRKRRQFLPVVLACLFVGLASAAIGWYLRPEDPLRSRPRGAASFPLGQKERTAAEQYLVALQLVNNEDAWRAVIAHPDVDKVVARAAKKQLALHYLRNARFDEAEEIFSEFEQTGRREFDDVQKAEGMAGRGVVASLRGEYRKSQEILLGELNQLRELLDAQMDDLVQQRMTRNTQALRQQTDAQIKNLREATGDNRTL